MLHKTENCSCAINFQEFHKVKKKKINISEYIYSELEHMRTIRKSTFL